MSQQEAERPALPDDLISAGILAAQMHLPPTVAESILTKLRDSGRTYGVPGAPRSAYGFNALVSRAEYVEVAADFVQRVPGVASAIASHRGIARSQDPMRKAMAAANAAARRAMRGEPQP